jgi:hypothetical protein
MRMGNIFQNNIDERTAEKRRREKRLPNAEYGRVLSIVDIKMEGTVVAPSVQT